MEQVITSSFLEDKLFKLSSFTNDWLTAELTPEESMKLTMIRKEGVPTGVYTTGNLGYIDPKKVRSYFCGECGKEYEGSPELRIYIEFGDERTGRHIIGNYIFLHYEETKLHGILGGPVLEEDAIDIKYIVEDNSGKFIPITRERIEKEIEKAHKRVDDGWKAFSEIREIEKLSKLAGFNFDKKIKELRKYDEDYEFKRYNQPENLKAMVENLSETMSFASFDYLESTGKRDTIEEFLDRLPKLTIPTELKENLKFVINSYTDLYEEALEESKNELRETKESIKREESEIKRLKKLLKYAH